MVLQLDADLPLVGQVPDERVPEQLLCARPLAVALHQAALDERLELLGPERTANVNVVALSWHRPHVLTDCTHHFFDLSLGAGLRGMRKSALIGCMSHSAVVSRQGAGGGVSISDYSKHQPDIYVYVRGAPSAISMAVIPRDHRSLCKDRTRQRAERSQTAQTEVFSALGHLEVVGGVRILFTGDDLRRHPIGRPDKSVPSSNGFVQLSRHTKVHCGANAQAREQNQMSANTVVLESEYLTF